MSITFTNTVYATSYVGEDDGIARNKITLDTVSSNPITLNGTVTNPGDPVTVTGTLPGGATNTTLYVTQFDNPSMIQFSDTFPSTANSFRYIFSNTPLAPRQVTNFDTDPALSEYQVACYARETLVRTPLGDVAVEDLAVGDLVVTASGGHRPIRWIGRRAYAGVFADRCPGLLPVRFAAGSLGPNVPARDLVVSPKHAMVIDGMLVPAEALVNGRTVTKAERVERIEYFHIELDSHDVLIAEGAKSESYVEDDNRAMFHNASEYSAANPGAVSVEAVYCLPRVEDGFALEAIRRRLAMRADELLGTASADLHEVVRAA